MLAQRAGMPVPQMLDDKRFREAKERKQKIAQMHKIAARYYFDMLFAQKGKDALEYLKGRGSAKRSSDVSASGFLQTAGIAWLRFWLTRFQPKPDK